MNTKNTIDLKRHLYKFLLLLRTCIEHDVTKPKLCYCSLQVVAQPNLGTFHRTLYLKQGNCSTENISA